MLDQSFSHKNLNRLISFSDFHKYNFGKEKAEISKKIEEIATKINAPDYKFSELVKIEEDDNAIYVPSTIEDEFALRKLNDNLKRLYKFKQANRFLIIEQIKSLLLEEIPMSIIKLDIKKFYETIDKDKIIKKLLEDPLLSYQSKQVLKKFFLLEDTSTMSGLPRGINISAAFSEIIMRDFDKKIAQLQGVYFYARYVDDIIIFTFQNPREIAKNAEEILLYETGLELNKLKTKIIERHCRCEYTCSCPGTCKCSKSCKCKDDPSKSLFFEYLGYRFTFSDVPEFAEKLVITLSKSKINRIKTRIMRSFLDFISNRNFNLLQSRLSFLTSNYIVKRNNKISLNAGIYYNYPHINEAGMTELEALTIFLRKIINAKSKSFGLRLNAVLTPANRLLLAKYCFKAGFVNRKLKRFSAREINTIKKCWIYG